MNISKRIAENRASLDYTILENPEFEQDERSSIVGVKREVVKEHTKSYAAFITYFRDYEFLFGSSDECFFKVKFRNIPGLFSVFMTEHPFLKSDFEVPGIAKYHVFNAGVWPALPGLGIDSHRRNPSFTGISSEDKYGNLREASYILIDDVSNLRPLKEMVEMKEMTGTRDVQAMTQADMNNIVYQLKKLGTTGRRKTNPFHPEILIDPIRMRVLPLTKFDADTVIRNFGLTFQQSVPVSTRPQGVGVFKQSTVGVRFAQRRESVLDYCVRCHDFGKFADPEMVPKIIALQMEFQQDCQKYLEKIIRDEDFKVMFCKIEILLEDIWILEETIPDRLRNPVFAEDISNWMEFRKGKDLGDRL